MILVLRYLIEDCSKITCSLVNMQLDIHSQLNVCNTLKIWILLVCDLSAQ